MHQAGGAFSARFFYGQPQDADRRVGRGYSTSPAWPMPAGLSLPSLPRRSMLAAVTRPWPKSGAAGLHWLNLLLPVPLTVC